MPFREPKICLTELIFCTFPIHINRNDNPEELRFLCDNAFFDNPYPTQETVSISVGKMPWLQARNEKKKIQHFKPKMSVNNFRIRVGKKGLGHIMTHNDTVS